MDCMACLDEGKSIRQRLITGIDASARRSRNGFHWGREASFLDFQPAYHYVMTRNTNTKKRQTPNRWACSP
eukprot:scaffold139747_cov18-Tisochrysis_lutea.AAC.1